ncbi:MAG: DUF1192 domain-containing protein [Proteobacteria bacterium]|nr:DUF1192 domain-containing protein [Pseudomonadota bacterium]MBW3616422.1 DUF1192 domain-containing protein [Pseudomonadota bacterium]
MFEDVPVRRTRGQALAELAREDLELYGVEELRERIQALEAEIARAQAAISKKQSGRAAADALFGGSE